MIHFVGFILIVISGHASAQSAEPSATEAGFYQSGYCSPGKCAKGPRNKILDGAAIAKAADKLLVKQSACMHKIVEAGRIEASCWGRGGAGCSNSVTAAAEYEQQPKSHGHCALALASALVRAKINKIGHLGNAVDMGPALQRIGFSNDVRLYPSPAQAPEGAILIYGVAQTQGCTGAGSRYGHAEIKDWNGEYLFDGKASSSVQERYGMKCRPLVGVYIPKAVANCG